MEQYHKNVWCLKTVCTILEFLVTMHAVLYVLKYVSVKDVVWEEAASLPLQSDPFIAAAHNRSTVFTRWRQCRCPYTIPWAHHTHYPKRQLDRFSGFRTSDVTFSQYVILYCAALFPQKLPLLLDSFGPYLICL